LHTEVKRVQGFLAEEDVGEDWLEDDTVSTVRPNKKRRLAAPIEKHRCVVAKAGTAVYLRDKHLVFHIIMTGTRKESI
jgi:hypothetical protein